MASKFGMTVVFCMAQVVVMVVVAAVIHNYIDLDLHSRSHRSDNY